MLSPGSKAPAFTLPSDSGEDFVLAGHRGEYVVVYFYPRDDTPGCTLEAQGFRDARAKLKKLGAIVVGVSKDTIKSHCRFRDKYGLDFPLLSDEAGEVVEAYGAWGEKTLYGKVSMGIIRSTVVVGPDGDIVAVFPKVRVDGHVDAVLATIAAHREGKPLPSGAPAKKAPAKKAASAEKAAPAKTAPAKKKAPAKKAPAKKAAAKKR